MAGHSAAATDTGKPPIPEGHHMRGTAQPDPAGRPASFWVKQNAMWRAERVEHYYSYAFKPRDRIMLGFATAGVLIGAFFAFGAAKDMIKGENKREM